MDPFTLFEPEFARRALLATLCVALAGGLLGTTVVLRDLPFFAHAIGSGTYPMLVLGAVWGGSTLAMGVGGATLFAGLLWLATRGRGSDPAVRDTRTGLLVAAALAVGALLAAAHAGDAGVAINSESMLFGSVLTVGGDSLAFAAVMALLAACAVFVRGESWLAAGFDRSAARALGVDRHDPAMLQIVALCVAAALPLTGALMAGALMVIPAATARLFTRRAASMTLASTITAIVAGVGGLYLSLAFDLPAGATIAMAAGAIFVVTALLVSLPRVTTGRAGAAGTAATLLLALSLAGCGSGDGGTGGVTASTSSEGLPVVATTTQVADLVKQIGGDHVAVTTLLKAGADPHEFEPTPSQVAALQEARVIFKNGGDIDAWLQPAIDAAGGGRKPIDLSNGAVLLPPGTPGDGATGATGAVKTGAGEGATSSTDGAVTGDDALFNSHWTLDPENLRSVALLVRDELIKADPKRRETYRARTADYRDAVAAANRKLLACADTVPSAKRSVAAGHDDFVYLTERYGFATAALLRENGRVEPSAADVERATADARSGDAQAMLVSKGEAGRLDESVAEALGVPLLELYGDSLAAADSPDHPAASSALGAIAFDLGKIVDAAGGDPSGCAAGI